MIIFAKWHCPVIFKMTLQAYTSFMQLLWNIIISGVSTHKNANTKRFSRVIMKLMVNHK